MNGDPKEYAVAYSAHGGSYRFDEDPTLPDAKLFTLAEAQEAVMNWRTLADTVFGDGHIIHIPSWDRDLTKYPFSF